MVVPSTAFLSFSIPDPFTEKGGEVPTIHVVEAPGRLLVAFYVVGEGQSKEGAIFDAVEAAKTFYVIAKSKSRFLMVGESSAVLSKGVPDCPSEMLLFRLGTRTGSPAPADAGSRQPVPRFLENIVPLFECQLLVDVRGRFA